MPVVVVIGGYSVPAAIMRFKRVMRPTNAGVSAGYRDSLPSEAQSPYIRGVGVSNARFDRRWSLRFLRRSRRTGDRRSLCRRLRLREIVPDVWIAFYSLYIRTSCQSFSHLARAFHQNRVHDVEGAMFDSALTQPLQNRALCSLPFVP